MPPVHEHDQRWKVLLKEFFAEFLGEFFSAYTAPFVLTPREWLDKELFRDPPSGEVQYVDLAARLEAKPDAPDGTPTIALIHVEVESRDSVQPFRQRMCDYYHFLRRTYNLPVLPLAVYLRVGLEGQGLDSYTESFGSLEVLKFQYPYLGLPALEAESYLNGRSWLGLALASLMRIEKRRKAWLRAELLRRLWVECPENDYRKFLLTEVVEAYLGLDEEQEREFEKILREPRYQEALPMMTTTFEKGIQKGLEQGQRQVLRMQLEQKFGPLSPAALRRLEEWPSERMPELITGILSSRTLSELGLDN
jgi:hypothetical protein